MKKAGLSFVIISTITFGLFGFNLVKVGGIQGRITPAQGANEIMVIKGVDTLRTKINNGAFVFTNVKKGTYTLLVKTNAPYKEMMLQNVAVVDSASTDVGEIKLIQ